MQNDEILLISTKFHRCHRHIHDHHHHEHLSSPIWCITEWPELQYYESYMYIGIVDRGNIIVYILINCVLYKRSRYREEKKTRLLFAIFFVTIRVSPLLGGSKKKTRREGCGWLKEWANFRANIFTIVVYLYSNFLAHK
jgi:hypothetical protein